MTENNQQKPNKSYSVETIKVMSVAFELGFIIALPIVLLALGGKWLDQRQGTGYYLYLGIALAVISSSAWTYARLKDFIRRLEDAAQIKKNVNPDQSAQKENQK